LLQRHDDVLNGEPAYIPCRLIGLLAVAFGFRRGEDVAFFQPEEDFIGKANGYFQPRGDFAGGGRWFGAGKVLNQMMGDLKRKQSFNPVAGLEGIRLEFIGIDILQGEGKLRPV